MRRSLVSLLLCVPSIVSAQEATGRYALDSLRLTWVNELPATLVRSPTATALSLPWGSTYEGFTSAIEIVPDTGQFGEFEYPFCQELLVAPDARVRQCPLSRPLPHSRAGTFGWFVRVGEHLLPVAPLCHEGQLVGYELSVSPSVRAAVKSSIEASLGAPVQETRVIPSVAPLVTEVAYLWKTDAGWVVLQHATSDETQNPPSFAFLTTQARAAIPDHPVWSGYVRCPLLSTLESGGERRRCR